MKNEMGRVAGPRSAPHPCPIETRGTARLPLIAPTRPAVQHSVKQRAPTGCTLTIRLAINQSNPSPGCYPACDRRSYSQAARMPETLTHAVPCRPISPSLDLSGRGLGHGRVNRTGQCWAWRNARNDHVGRDARLRTQSARLQRQDLSLYGRLPRKDRTDFPSYRSTRLPIIPRYRDRSSPRPHGRKLGHCAPASTSGSLAEGRQLIAGALCTSAATDAQRGADRP